jgi:hypothetical protein
MSTNCKENLESPEEEMFQKKRIYSFVSFFES